MTIPVTISAVPAMHSSDPGGRPLGYVVTFADGRSLYHTGDTWLFGDMALIQELYHPDILVINAGSPRWGMSPRVAALAVRKSSRRSSSPCTSGPSRSWPRSRTSAPPSPATAA